MEGSSSESLCRLWCSYREKTVPPSNFQTRTEQRRVLEAVIVQYIQIEITCMFIEVTRHTIFISNTHAILCRVTRYRGTGGRTELV